MNGMLVVRALVLGCFGYAAVVAATHWAVRNKHLQPFGRWPRFVRRVSDPVLTPIERRLVQAGRNPQDATVWLLGIVVLGGLVTLSLAGWLAGFWYLLGGALSGGPRGVAKLLVNSGYSILMLALIVRIVGSWFGVGRYRPWMKPAYWLTDWMILPIRRFLPPMGMIDFSPMVAWVVLLALRIFILSFLG